MLLQRLVEYGRRTEEGAPPVGYKLEPVKYWIELDAQGNLRGIVSVEPTEGKRPKAVPMPTLVRSVSIKPKLLADNGAYTLGAAREGDKPARVADMHRAFVELIDDCAEATDEPTVRAVGLFLHAHGPGDLPLPPDFDPTATIGFHVDGVTPTELPSVQSYWMRRVGEGETMQCLVCGQERPAMARLQLKLKGIPGGQTAGLALISANAAAFESHGPEASYIAPTCQECGDRFMKAANDLIRGSSTHLTVGNVVYIFWTRSESSVPWATLLSGPEPDEVQLLLRSAFHGRQASVESNQFFAAGLSASGARAVVRDWIDTTVERAQDNLVRFFHLQSLVDPYNNPPHPYGVFALAGALTRTGARDTPPPQAVAALVHCALAGGPLPESLLFGAVHRCRLEQRVTRPRAALIKMVLLSVGHRADTEGGEMTELDVHNSDPAYLCGRLFAELEAAQYAALGEVGANVVDRYYGTASSAPATVFGRLVRGVQPHLGKLRRDRPGAYHGIDRRLQEILERLESFPTTLTLQQQGTFALGYYHQRAADQLAARARRGQHDTMDSPQPVTEEE